MSIEHFNLQDYNYHKAHHAELLRMSEISRLVDQARQNRKGYKSISHHVLGWIGQYLVTWGKQLQDRYGNNRETPYLDSSRISW